MSEKSILLVEGNNDKHVVLALRDKYNLPKSFEITNCNDVENLIKQIPFRIKNGTEILGVLLDADENINSRWLELKKIFEEIDFNMPNELPAEGFITTNNENIKIGIWIMPNNKTSGMLEDFLVDLVSEDDKLMPFANEILTKIEDSKINNYKLIHKTKALIHTWLAWQKNPGNPMGQSITHNYFNTSEANCIIFSKWLDKLFN